MREEAEARIGHHYPKVKVTEAMVAEREDLKPHIGKELTIIAWLWARTVASPDPMMRGTHVPLVSSFILSSKNGRKEAIVIPIVDREKGKYRFTVKVGGMDADTIARARRARRPRAVPISLASSQEHRYPAKTSESRGAQDGWAPD